MTQPARGAKVFPKTKRMRQENLILIRYPRLKTVLMLPATRLQAIAESAPWSVARHAVICQDSALRG